MVLVGSDGVGMGDVPEMVGVGGIEPSDVSGVI